MKNDFVYYKLDKIREIAGDNHDLVKELVQLFLENNQRNLENLNSAFETGDLLTVSELAHKMKASIDLWSIAELTSDIRTLENLAKEGAAKLVIEPLVQKLNSILKLVLEDLARL